MSNFGNFQERISVLIGLSEKTQKEIADELGYANANVVTMFKSGKTKVPLSKVPKLAKSLGADPVHMLKLAMKQYQPDLLPAIEEHLFTASQKERMLIEGIREKLKGDELTGAQIDWMIKSL